MDFVHNFQSKASANARCKYSNWSVFVFLGREKCLSWRTLKYWDKTEIVVAKLFETVNTIKLRCTTFQHINSFSFVFFGQFLHTVPFYSYANQAIGISRIELDKSWLDFEAFECNGLMVERERGREKDCKRENSLAMVLSIQTDSTNFMLFFFQRN